MLDCERLNLRKIAADSWGYTMEKNNGRIRPFGEVLRQRIDSGLALEVLHDAARGKEITKTQVEASKVLLSKCLPDLKAVAVAVGEASPATLADIQGMLLAANLKPDQVFSRPPAIEGESVHLSGHSESSDDTK